MSRRPTVIGLLFLLVGALAAIGMNHTALIRGDLLPVTTNPTVVQRVKSVFDTDENGVVSVFEIYKNIRSALIRYGTRDRSIDFDGDGQVTSNDRRLLVPSLRTLVSDQCPFDPIKNSPGVCGCGIADTDSDGDGTADCLDRCVNDPDKNLPGACGCMMPDVDSNHDGVLECLAATDRTNELLAPSGLIGGVTELTDTTATVRLTWNDNSWNEQQFRIDVQEGDEPYRNGVPVDILSNEIVQREGLERRGALVRNLTPGRTYSFRVVAVQGGQTSEPSRPFQLSTEPFYLERSTVCNIWLLHEQDPRINPLPSNFRIYKPPRGGNGVTDNYVTLRVFKETASGATREKPAFMIFPPGRYKIDQYIKKSDNIKNIPWLNLSYTRLLGCGQEIGDVVFDVAGNYDRTVDAAGSQVNSQDGLQVFRFVNADHVTVEGMEFDGNVQDASRMEANFDGNNAGILFYGSRNYTVRDMNIHHFGVDGFYLGGAGVRVGDTSQTETNPADREARIADKHVRVHNVRLANNGRQAMTLAQARDVWISNTQFLDTGRTDSPNFAALGPSAGLDLEPNFFDRSRNINDHEHTGSFKDIRVDVRTGDILVENSIFARNIGSQMAAVLGRQLNTYLDQNGECCTAGCSEKCAPPFNVTRNTFVIWPNPRTEHITFKHSLFLASEDSSPIAVAMGVLDGTIDHSCIDLRAVSDGRLWLTYHGGSSAGANTNDTHMESTINATTVLANTIAIEGYWSRHPLTIMRSILHGTLSIATSGLVPSYADREKRIEKSLFFIPPSVANTATSAGAELMHAEGTNFEGNRYCIAREDAPLSCEDPNSEQGYLFMNYGAIAHVVQDVYSAGCSLRPLRGFLNCNSASYTFSRP